MLDIGWTELLLIGIVALIVVGPKDLPGMFRTLGRFTGKMKGMAREFQRAMNDAADDAGVKDIAGDLKKATSARNLGLDKLSDAASKFEKWQPGKSPVGDKGPETQKLSEERAEAARKIRDATAKRASERIAAEAAEKTQTPAPAVQPDPTPQTPAKAKAAKPKAAAKPKTAAKPATAKPKAPKPKAKPAKAAGTDTA